MVANAEQYGAEELTWQLPIKNSEEASMVDPTAPSACGGQPVGCSAEHPGCRCRGDKNGKKRQKMAEFG